MGMAMGLFRRSVPLVPSSGVSRISVIRLEREWWVWFHPGVRRLIYGAMVGLIGSALKNSQLRCWVSLGCLLGCLLSIPLAGAAQISHVNGQILFVGSPGSIAFNDTNGTILSVTPAGSGGSVWKSGEYGLWNATFKEGGAVNAAAFGTNSIPNKFSWAADSGGDILRLNYTNSDIGMSVVVSNRSDGVDFSARVRPALKTVLELSLPARLRFAQDAVSRLVCPLNGNESVGAAFKAGFFQSQPEATPAGWSTVAKGPTGYISLFGSALISRPDNDPAVPISITTNGQAWLSTNIAGRWNGSNAVVNRPSTASPADLVLADSTNGPYFSASHLSGKGWLFRLGGGVGDNQKSLAMDLVVGALEHLAQTPPAGRTKVGLLALYHGPANGGWAAVGVSDWRDRLRVSTVLPASGIEVVEIPAVQSLLDALAATNFLAILNPYGEWTPVLESAGMSGTVSAVGGYVRAGGSWFEVGGYSFYYELRPNHYYSYGTPYPPAFADFLHLEATAGAASLYGVQPQVWAPWAGATNPAALFVPGRLAWGADSQGGYCERAFGTCVGPGQNWTSPPVRLALSHSAADALLGYCQANQITRRLEDKLAPAALDKFKRSVLVYYDGTCSNKLAHLDQLPSPALIHFADYLMGGFDKQYPDHLPPNASFGTPQEFRNLLARSGQLGLLIMPYTNPTWWCDHPRGPTFVREGTAPLLKKFDGSLSYELYGANDGYTVCHWQPAVQAANWFTVQQFTTNYPVDVLFQDQCGARTWLYDTNSASPTPYAYAEGLVSMVAEDSRTKPLSTENGWDRIVNFESQLCGLTWAIVPTEGAPSWRTFMKDQFPPETWDIFPLAQYIAHDKTALVHHDLGQFVTDDEVLAWTIGLGYSLSYRISATDVGPGAALEWLRWLDRLQKSVCARYVGQPISAFAQDRGTNSAEPDGLVRASYGPVDVVANLTSQSQAVQGWGLAPFGFVATAPGLMAAHLNDLSPSAPGQADASFVVETVADQIDFWVYATGDRSLALQLPQNTNGVAALQLDGRGTNRMPVQNGVLTLSLGFKPTQERLLPPPELAGLAPRDWPGPKPAIGILNLPGMPRSWTRLTPDDWVRTFAGSRLATQFGVPIRPITNFTGLTAALQAGPTVWLGLINPGGEIFPASGAGAGPATLALIHDYVNHGGSWWETAGYSFYTSGFIQGTTWQTETIGPQGMGSLGLPVGGGDVAQAAEPLTVTALGQNVFGATLSAQLQGMTSVVNRGLVRTADDPGHLALLAGAQQDFLGAYRLEGWGYLWRIGGFWPNTNVVLRAAAATMEYLYTQPPLPFVSGPTKYLWHGRLMVESAPVLKDSSGANGVFSFRIADCPTGATNYLERSSNPASSSAWQEVFTFLSPPLETNWTDPSAPTFPRAFYRIKSVFGP